MHRREVSRWARTESTRSWRERSRTLLCFCGRECKTPRCARPLLSFAFSPPCPQAARNVLTDCALRCQRGQNRPRERLDCGRLSCCTAVSPAPPQALLCDALAVAPVAWRSTRALRLVLPMHRSCVVARPRCGCTARAWQVGERLGTRCCCRASFAQVRDAVCRQKLSCLPAVLGLRVHMSWWAGTKERGLR